jgi:hypothetical protein
MFTRRLAFQSGGGHGWPDKAAYFSVIDARLMAY